MAETARDRDPRSMVPLRVHPGFKKFPITVQLIEDVILGTTGLRATYIFSNFDGIFITRRVPSSTVMVNRRTRRLAVLVNPDFMKRIVVSRATKLKHRSDRSLPRSQDFMTYDSSLEDEDSVMKAIDKAIQEVIKHEFSHIWFHHLQRESTQPHFLLNVVHDTLLNYHMKVDLGLTRSCPWMSPNLFINAITFIGWVRQAIGHYGDADDLLEVIAEGYHETMSDEAYVALRCFKALKAQARPGMRTPTL